MNGKNLEQFSPLGSLIFLPDKKTACISLMISSEAYIWQWVFSISCHFEFFKYISIPVIAIPGSIFVLVSKPFQYELRLAIFIAISSPCRQAPWADQANGFLIDRWGESGALPVPARRGGNRAGRGRHRASRRRRRRERRGSVGAGVIRSIVCPA